MKYITLISVGALVFFTACAGLPFDLSGLFGSDVIKVNPITIQEGTRDVVIISNKQTIPNSPLLPNTPVLFSFVIENVDTLKTVKKVDIDLFDAPTFYSDFDNINKGKLCNEDTENCLPIINGILNCFHVINNENSQLDSRCDILPGDNELVNFKLRAPKETDIAGIRTQTTFNFKANYDFESSLLYVVPFVNYDEIVQRQRAGEPITLTLTKSHSSGPLQIDAQLIGTNYFLADQAGVLNFKIRNTGKGNVLNSRIEKAKFNIVFPEGLEVAAPANFLCGKKNEITDIVRRDIRDIDFSSWSAFFSSAIEIGGRFIKLDDIPTDANVCSNKDPIDLFKDETQATMRFEVKLKTPLTGPFRSYDIRANVEYTYELRDSFDVTINPFGNT